MEKTKENQLYGITYKTDGGCLLKYVLGKTPKEAQEEFKKEFPEREILECQHIGKRGNTNCKIYMI